MKAKFLKAKLFGQWVVAIVFLILIGISMTCSDSFAVSIKYLRPIDLKIGAGGVNRLNFGDDRIVKIVGDQSQYNALTSGNGSDLFLTSKIPAGGIIDLILVSARNESVDLKLHVVDKLDATIINVSLEGRLLKGNEERQEITLMINAMKTGTNGKGKYFVEGKTRLVKTSIGEGDITLEQNVSYRYGNLLGTRYVYKTKKGMTELSEDDVRRLFKDVLAISIDNREELIKVFVVSKAEEIRDV